MAAIFELFAICILLFVVYKICQNNPENWVTIWSDECSKSGDNEIYCKYEVQQNIKRKKKFRIVHTGNYINSDIQKKANKILASKVL